MKVFDPITLPKLPLWTPPTQQTTSIAYVDGSSLLERMGLEYLIGKIETVSAWIKPKTYVEVHKDFNVNGTPSCMWSILWSPIGHENVDVEIYKQLPNTEIVYKRHPKALIPELSQDKVQLTEVWNMTNGSCIFNPGAVWHTGRNKDDVLRNIISFRSMNTEHLEYIKSKFTKIL